MKTVLERFLDYVSLDTTSHEDTGTYPSTPSQLELGRRLAAELRELGLEDAAQDRYGYVTATIPSTVGEGPVVGLLAHMDTSDAVSGRDIRPRVVEYQGGDILLNGEKGIVLSPADYPFLTDCAGRHLVVTDGTTLLGADDKAGVAEIMTMAERLMAPDAPPHGKIRIAFTPDEEIGGGVQYFDIRAFGADTAYTVDGGPLGELKYETFNAAAATVEITGRSIHPGEAKGKMINAAVVGCELLSMLPAVEQPAHTEGYQGFFHLFSIRGDVEHCVLKMIIREHDARKFQGQKDWLTAVAHELDRRWGAGTVKLTIRDQYYNMRQAIQDHMEVVDRAAEAFKACGVQPIVHPIRGGTDGAHLSLAGLPCPNLSTGGYNYHGRFEFIPVESMEKMVDVLVYLVTH